MGPTASGKTLIANALHKVLPITIISVDSVLIYRHMDIGTAKPTLEEQELIPYKLINIRDPKESYSVAEFLKDALWEIKNIISRGRIPLLVGGSMFYFKTLLHGLTNLPSANWNIRRKIEIYANKFGWHSIHDYLKKIDPITASKIHPHDIQRTTRALEIFLISKKSLTDLTKSKKIFLPYDVIQFAIIPTNRDILYDRIYVRYKNMLYAGFENEVRKLYHRGDLHAGLPSMRSVGYRQMWLYLSGNISYEEMQYRWICATRQLAKKQITWLKHWNNLYILDIDKVYINVQKILDKI